MHRRIVSSERIWLWPIVIVGGMLRLHGLDSQSLWLDEGLQYYVAINNTIGELLGQTRSFHPPLSFLINHLFLQIQESEVFLRLPSALFGIATLPVFYVLAKELTSRQVALISTSILTFSAFHVWYSQEGRMYSQLLFFSLLSSVVLLRALKRKGLQWWLVYVLVSTAGMYTQIFMVLALLAQFLWVLLYHRDRFVAHLVSGVAVFILFLPWVIFLPWVRRFFQSLTEHAMAAAAPVPPRAAFRAGFSWESIPYTLFAYSAGFSFGPTVAELHESRTVEFILRFTPEISLVAVVFGTLLLVGVPALYKLFGVRSANFCLIGLSIPIVGALLYALAPRATYNVRYSIVAFPYFCIIVATGTTYIFQKCRPAGVTLSLGIMAVSATSLSNHFFNPRYAKEDIRAAVAFWRSESKLEPLLSYQSHPVVSVYLRGMEREQHFPLSREVVSDIDRVLSKSQAPSAYILLARDWRQVKENGVRASYGVDFEKTYQGVTLLKISNLREKAHNLNTLIP